MYIFSVDEAQKDLPNILEMVAQGKDVAIAGERPVLLLKVKSVGNFANASPESCGSIIVFEPEDESLLEDEAFKPLSDDMIEEFYGPIFPEEADTVHESQ
jgi:hypothetical protein